jgi:hypothetical protein
MAFAKLAKEISWYPSDRLFDLGMEAHIRSGVSAAILSTVTCSKRCPTSEGEEVVMTVI